MRSVVAFALALSCGLGMARAQDLAGWEIGTRILHIELDEDSRPGTLRPGADPSRQLSYDGRFLGTISELDVDQQYLPVRLFAQYFFNKNFGVGISYDEVEAEARDDFASDGTLSIRGPILYGVGRLATKNGFTPFAEVGAGFYFSDFDPNSAWAAKGTFAEKTMDTDDVIALVLGLGCDYAVAQNCSIHLYARAVLNATVDAKAYFPNQGGKLVQNGEGEFPLDYYGFGIGVKYAFK
ncbi:MAG TPA: outer membrane beta-barrel protein [Kiritimatiellia bacterium]|nr:outer membrane beta-barrel protein [Kiritimatiellia bacterium]